jgi:hypothetical protein
VYSRVRLWFTLRNVMLKLPFIYGANWKIQFNEIASLSAELPVIKRSVSTVYPEGDATLAWLALADRYEPKNAVDQQTLMTELFTSTLENGSKDPEVWIVELQRMQTKVNAMGATVSDNMVKGHILSRLPPEYDHVADNLASQESKTVASVSSILKDKYERLK